MDKTTHIHTYRTILADHRSSIQHDAAHFNLGLMRIRLSHLLIHNQEAQVKCDTSFYCMSICLYVTNARTLISKMWVTNNHESKFLAFACVWKQRALKHREKADCV